MDPPNARGMDLQPPTPLRLCPVVVGDEESPRDVAAEVGDASVAHEGATGTS
jgi:hypothetical protein